MSQLLDYIQRIAPGVALGITLLALLSRAHPGARLCVHLALFVLLRDAMTPLGLWHIDASPVFWLRLPAHAWSLIALGLATLAITLALIRFEPELARGIVWLRGRAVAAAAVGCAAAVLVWAPVALAAHGTPIAARGAAIPLANIAPLLAFSLFGNAYEELLFRGFLQGLLVPQLGPGKALLVAGLGFAFGHVFLAATVTDIGWPILLFTAYEGLICAALSRYFGLFAAVLAHGFGIFLIAMS